MFRNHIALCLNCDPTAEAIIRAARVSGPLNHLAEHYTQHHAGCAAEGRPTRREQQEKCTCGLFQIHDQLLTLPAMREDVFTFAKWMAAAMDSKKIERETRGEPHYMAKEYPIEHAIDCLKDKTDQLAYWVKMQSPAERANSEYAKENLERVRKTAVHLANFAMIIADVVLNYRPKSKQPKPRKRKRARRAKSS